MEKRSEILASKPTVSLTCRGLFFYRNLGVVSEIDIGIESDIRNFVPRRGGGCIYLPGLFCP